MVSPLPMSLTKELDALFAAERSVRAAHADLVGKPRGELLDELQRGVSEALAMTVDESEQALRLVRLGGLLGDLEGDRVVDLLIAIVGSHSAEARVVAGEALEALAFERFKEVALGIERAVDSLPSGSPALTELPYLLAEVGEPGCVRLLGRFLKHRDAEAVAAAVEALAELGDPSAVPLLSALERDPRQVELEDQGERISIGDLAREARELLENLADDSDSSQNRTPPKRGPAGSSREHTS